MREKMLTRGRFVLGTAALVPIAACSAPGTGLVTPSKSLAGSSKSPQWIITNSASGMLVQNANGRTAAHFSSGSVSGTITCSTAFGAVALPMFSNVSDLMGSRFASTMQARAGMLKSQDATGWTSFSVAANGGLTFADSRLGTLSSSLGRPLPGAPSSTGQAISPDDCTYGTTRAPDDDGGGCGGDDPLNEPLTSGDIITIANQLGDGDEIGIMTLATGTDPANCVIAKLEALGGAAVTAARANAIIQAIAAAAELGETVPGINVIELAGLITISLAAVLYVMYECGM